MQDTKQEKKYQLSGQVGGGVNQLIALSVMVGVAVLVLIFVGVLSGQVYETGLSTLLENSTFIGTNCTISCNASGFGITNDTVRNHVGGSVLAGFNAFEQTGNYLPILVLAFIISLVLSLVLGFANLGGGSNRGGTAL